MTNTKKGYTPRKEKPPGLPEFAKLPPQAIDLEEAVLGAIMLDSTCLNGIIDMLQEEMFYKEAHQIIYAAIVGLYKDSLPVDILTVTKEIKKKGDVERCGGVSYITSLTNKVSSAANSEYHARIIQEQYIKRSLIQQCSKVVTECYEPNDVFTLIDKSQTLLNDLTAQVIRNKEKDTGKLVQEFLDHIVKVAKNEKPISGVPTTLSDLDATTGGWQNTDLIIVAGRPGSGKSAFTKPCIKGAIRLHRKPVLVFSLEMSSLQYMSRLISEDTEIPAKDYLSGRYKYNIEYGNIESAANSYFDDNGNPLLIIDDTPSLTINELKARAKRVHAEHGICLIVIDYLQLISSVNAGKFENRVVEVSTISRNLKILAKELNVPVIALSQLNREVEQAGGDMRPKLSHLRESGSIEQDADLVIFMYRPEYYAEQGQTRFEQVEIDGVTISSKGFAEAIIAKHRNGSVRTVYLKFIPEFTRFENWVMPVGDSNGISPV